MRNGSAAAYSDLKAAWHLDAIAGLRRGEQIVPRQIQLILSDLCNQDCHFCAYRMTGGFSTEQFALDGNKNPNRMIPLAKAIEILEDAASLGVEAIQFTGGGEPTVHPNHLALFSRCMDLGMEAALVTNGYITRPGWLDVLPRMKWIRVSVDAGSAGTYAAVRNAPLSAWERVTGNLGQLAVATIGRDCLLGVGYVLTLENWQELDAACKLFAGLGVPYVRLSAMFSAEGHAYYGGQDGEIRDEIAAARKRHESDRFKIVDLFSDRLADLDQGAPDYQFCGYQQFNMYIGANLKVYRCCTTSYTKHGEVGDLTNTRLRDWFQSDQKRQAYGTFDARTCHVCQFNGKNRVINYMVQPEPMHAAFV